MKSIIQQKVGATPKAIKIVEEHLTKLRNLRGSLPPTGVQDSTILVKKAKITLTHIVRWKGYTCTPDDQKQPASSSGPNNKQYTSRMFKCTKCENSKETAGVQLRTRRGYRDIYCCKPICKQHERCTHNRCQCGLIWHQCPIHRYDPSQPRTTTKNSGLRKTPPRKRS